MTQHALPWKTEATWQLQSALDHISFALDLPLQAFDLTAARNFYAVSCGESATFRSAFPDKEDFHQYVREVSASPEFGIPRCSRDKHIWRALLENEICSLWRTKPSYENPLLHIFREHWGWRWWETLWFFHEFVLSTNARHVTEGGPEILSMPGFPGRFFSVGTIGIAEVDIVLVALPKFRGPGFPNATSNIADREELVTDFQQVLQSADTTLRYEVGRLLRLTASRSGIAEPDLRLRLGLSQRAMRTLARAQVANPERLTDGVFRRLVFVALLYSENPPPKRTWGSKFEPKRVSISDRQDSKPLVLVEVADGNDQPPRLDVGESLDTRPPAVTIAKLEFMSALDDRELVAISLLFDRINTCKHAYRLENYLLIRTWLNETFGELVEERHAQVRHTPDTNAADLGRRLCRWAARLFDADICTLTRYDYKSADFEMFGFYTTDHEHRDNWERIGRASLTRSAGFSSDALGATSQRCIQLNALQFVPSVGALEHKPSGFVSPEGRSEIRSAISVPIEFLGRPWGVLSVFGFRDYQFDTSSRDSLQDFAGLLSPHYYYQWLLGKCQELDAAGLNDDLVTSERYQRLCAFLCDVLLVESATIWTAVDGSSQFTAPGWVNRPDLERGIFFSGLPQVDQKTISQVAVSQGPNVRHWAWHSMSLSGLTLEDGQRSIGTLRKQEFHTWCQAPIYTTNRNEIGAIVTLLAKSPRRDTNQWQNVTKVVSNEVAMFVRSTRSRADWTAEQRHSIAHELNQAVRSISQASDALAKMVDVSRLATRAERVQYDKLQIQVRNAGEELTDTMEALVSNSGHLSDAVIPRDPVLLIASQIKTPADKPVDFRSYFNELSRPLERESGNRVHFIYVGPRSGPLLWVDQRILRRVIGNLCTNAAKYALRGSEIIVRVLQDPDTLRIIVRNFGAELLPDEEDSMFDKGFRGQAAKESGIAGEGLGLYYAFKIAQMHGLSLTYDQHPDPRPGLSLHEFKVLIPVSLLKLRGQNA